VTSGEVAGSRVRIVRQEVLAMSREAASPGRSKTTMVRDGAKTGVDPGVALAVVIPKGLHENVVGGRKVGTNGAVQWIDRNKAGISRDGSAEIPISLGSTAPEVVLGKVC